MTVLRPGIFEGSDQESNPEPLALVKLTLVQHSNHSAIELHDVESYPPKVHFSENHILAPKKCCASKFLHALNNDQFLLAHPSQGTGPPYNFFQKGSKIGLNCNK